MVHVLLLFIDGFGYNYLNSNHTYFSKIIKENYCLPLKSILGFSSSIKASIWTSTYPSTHGLWTYWGHIPDRKNNPPILYKIFRPIPSLKMKIFIRHVIRYILTSIQSPSVYMFMASVTDELAPYFSRLSPEITSEEEINGIQTLFGILREKGIDCTYFETTKYVVPELDFEKRDESLDVIFIPNFDGLGHRFGPYSSEVHYEIKKLNSYIETLMDRFKTIKDFHFLFFSDHGMARIIERVNIQEVIDQLPFKQPTDYLAFYDSTLVRFWFFNSDAKKQIINSLQCLNCGKILTKNEKKNYGINFKHNFYGETIFLVNTGYEIFPNYFVSLTPVKFLENRLTKKGMHGYDPEHPSQYGIFFYYGKMKKSLSKYKNFRIIDIAPFILKIFSIKQPHYFEGGIHIEE